MKDRLLSALAVFIAAAAITPLRANDTALNAGGYGPAPLGEFEGEESVIRMVSESIDIHFAKKESQVHCRFTFRSSKKSGDAKQAVGFPDLLQSESDSGQIHKLETLVNGEKVEAKKVRGWFSTASYGTPRSGLGDPPATENREEVQRADFFVVEVNFPPDKDVVIERTYTADSGGDVMGTTTFYYTTHTGAVWKGTIGQADFHVTLDGFTVDDLAFEDGKSKIPPRQQTAWCMPNRAEWTVVSPKELKMTWKDFEPAVQVTRRGIRLATWSKPQPGE